MKLFKKLFLTGASLLLALSVGASLNNAHANSQTNKLPHYMRNMWYGNMSEDGLKSIKLYGSPYINNGYSHLPINHIKRYGYRYDLNVPDADPIEVWYSNGHLNGLESGTAHIHLYAHTKHHRVNRISQWYQNHTYRNRVHYSLNNNVSSKHYQLTFINAEDENDGIAVTSSYHNLLKGINNSSKYKVSRMIKSTAPFQAKYLRSISGKHNGNDADVYAIKYRGHKYYYADNMTNKGGSDALQGYNAYYYKGTIYSWTKPYYSDAYLKRRQYLHKNVDWDYENPYSNTDTFYQYHDNHWTETSDSDNIPNYIADN